MHPSVSICLALLNGSLAVGQFSSGNTIGGVFGTFVCGWCAAIAFVRIVESA